MKPKAWTWLALGVIGAAAVGITLGASIGQAAAERPVVTVYKSPT